MFWYGWARESLPSQRQTREQSGQHVDRPGFFKQTNDRREQHELHLSLPSSCGSGGRIFVEPASRACPASSSTLRMEERIVLQCDVLISGLRLGAVELIDLRLDL
mmetsp:Transcript_108254/g.345724  ORF Transcript_108254/g.345724 Transcript_108254/m.345724 type:complete len:105 (+) Transcript_108254:200-514(+)